jgi:hypothetical protein
MTRISKSSLTTDSVAATRNGQNLALSRCVDAWQRTFDLASDDPDDESLSPPRDDSTLFAREQAAIAFREAMPPLAGAENIRDFIARIANAILKRIFSKDECAHLYSVAKLALALLRAEPKVSVPGKV